MSIKVKTDWFDWAHNWQCVGGWINMNFVDLLTFILPSFQAIRTLQSGWANQLVASVLEFIPACWPTRFYKVSMEPEPWFISIEIEIEIKPSSIMNGLVSNQNQTLYHTKTSYQKYIFNNNIVSQKNNRINQCWLLTNQIQFKTR